MRHFPACQVLGRGPCGASLAQDGGSALAAVCLALGLAAAVAATHPASAFAGDRSASPDTTLGSGPVQEKGAAQPVMLAQGLGDALRGPGGIIKHALECGTIGDVGLDRCEEDGEAASSADKPPSPPPLGLESGPDDPADTEREEARDASDEPDPEDRDEAADHAETDAGSAADRQPTGGRIGARAKRFADGALVVYMLIRGAPAHEAGLKPGDEIVAVDGTDIAGLRDEEVLDLLRGPFGEEVDIAVRRGGDLERIVLTRAELPGDAEPLIGAKATGGAFADLDLSERQQFAIGAIQEWRAREIERIREIAASRIAEVLNAEQQARLRAIEEESAARVDAFLEELQQGLQADGQADKR